MADSNIFARSPVDEAAKRHERSIMGALTPPSPQVSSFEDIARQHQVPLNVLRAVADETGIADDAEKLRFATEFASRIAPELRSGKKMPDAMRAVFGHDAPVEPVLEKAIRMARGEQVAPGADGRSPTATGEQAQPGVVGDLSRQGVGGVIKGAGHVIAGLGRFFGSMEMDERLVTDSQARFDPETGEYKKRTPEQQVEFYRQLAATPRPETEMERNSRAAAKKIAAFGEGIQAGVSDESKAAIASSTPNGDLFKPSTWTLGENPSVRGYAMLTADVLGSLAPVVLASVVTKSPMGGAVAGGAQSAGAAAQEARRTVLEAGPERLAQESAYYREAIAQGRTPEEATELVAVAAERMSALFAAPVGGLGGAFTGAIATKGVGPLAGKSAATRILGTGALSAAEEGAQEVGETMAGRFGTEVASGLDIDLTEGTFGDAVLGALAGGPVGAISGIRDGRQGDQGADPAADPLDPATGQPQDGRPGEDGHARVPTPGTPGPGPATPAPPPPGAPLGPLARADQVVGPAPTPPAPLLPELPKGARLTIDIKDGSPVEAQFVSQDENHVAVTIDGEPAQIPRADIEAGDVTISPVDVLREKAGIQAPKVDNQPVQVAPPADLAPQNSIADMGEFLGGMGAAIAEGAIAALRRQAASAQDSASLEPVAQMIRAAEGRGFEVSNDDIRQMQAITDAARQSDDFSGEINRGLNALFQGRAPAAPAAPVMIPAPPRPAPGKLSQQATPTGPRPVEEPPQADREPAWVPNDKDPIGGDLTPYDAAMREARSEMQDDEVSTVAMMIRAAEERGFEVSEPDVTRMDKIAQAAQGRPDFNARIIEGMNRLFRDRQPGLPAPDQETVKKPGPQESLAGQDVAPSPAAPVAPETAPDQEAINAEFGALLERATAVKDQMGTFFEGMEAAKRGPAIREDSLPFYRRKVEEAEARAAGQTDKIEPETDVLSRYLTEDRTNKMGDAIKVEGVQDAYVRADAEIARLADRINKAGYRIEDVNPTHGGEFRDDRARIASIAGAVNRLLGHATAIQRGYQRASKEKLDKAFSQLEELLSPSPETPNPVRPEPGSPRTAFTPPEQDAADPFQRTTEDGKLITGDLWNPYKLRSSTLENGYKIEVGDRYATVNRPDGTELTQAPRGVSPMVILDEIDRDRGIKDGLNSNGDAALIHYAAQAGLTNKDRNDALSWEERSALIDKLRGAGYVSTQSDIIQKPLSKGEFLDALPVDINFDGTAATSKGDGALIQKWHDWMRQNPGAVQIDQFSADRAGLKPGTGVKFTVTAPRADGDKDSGGGKNVSVEYFVYGDRPSMTSAVPPGDWNGIANHKGNFRKAVKFLMENAGKAPEPERGPESGPARPAPGAPGYTFKLADRFPEKDQKMVAANRDSTLGYVFAQLDQLARRAESQLRREGADIRDFEVDGKGKDGKFNQWARMVGDAQSYAEDLIDEVRKTREVNPPPVERDEDTGDLIPDDTALYAAMQFLEDAEAMSPPVDEVDEGGDYDPGAEIGTMPEEDIFPGAEKTITHLTLSEKGPFITQEEGDALVQSWKDAAAEIGKTKDNSKKVVISLFDYTGAWSQPWVDAGYQVQRLDIKSGTDALIDEAFILERIEDYRRGGLEVVGVLSACPCTTFTGTGARWWPELHDKESPEAVEKVFGSWGLASGAKSPLEYNQMLYEQTKVVIAAAAPTRFHVLENPVGRIDKVTDIGKPLLRFQPNNYGDPYTKRTQLFGTFDADLPQANVPAVEGSKIQSKLRGTDPLQKEQRSVTPTGFAYAFFMANDPDAKAMVGEIEALPSAAPEPEAPAAPKKSNLAADKPMQDYSGIEINGYDDETSEDGRDSPIKNRFKKDSTRWGRALAATLADMGFEEATSRQGKKIKPMSWNQSGISGSGEMSVMMAGPNGFGAYVTVGQSAMTRRGGLTVMWRISKNSDPYGSGFNEFADAGITPRELAEKIKTAHSRRADAEARKTEAPAGGPKMSDYLPNVRETKKISDAIEVKRTEDRVTATYHGFPFYEAANPAATDVSAQRFIEAMQGAVRDEGALVAKVMPAFERELRYQAANTTLPDGFKIEVNGQRAKLRGPDGKVERDRLLTVDLGVDGIADAMAQMKAAADEVAKRSAPSGDQPAGPRVFVNVVGPDGQTDAERGGPYRVRKADGGLFATEAALNAAMNRLGLPYDRYSFVKTAEGYEAVWRDKANEPPRQQTTVPGPEVQKATKPAPKPKAETKAPTGAAKAWADFTKAAGDVMPVERMLGKTARQAQVSDWISGLPKNQLQRVEAAFRPGWNPFESDNPEAIKAEIEAFLAEGAEVTPEKPKAGILGALSQEKQDRAAELKRRLADKARNQTSAGLDPEYITLGGELVALYIEAGAKRFGEMLRDFAETTGLTMREAQEPMRAAYNHVRDNMELAGEDISGMDDARAVMDEVRRAIAESEQAAPDPEPVPEPAPPKRAPRETEDEEFVPSQGHPLSRGGLTPIGDGSIWRTMINGVEYRVVEQIDREGIKVFVLQNSQEQITESQKWAPILAALVAAGHDLPPDMPNYMQGMVDDHISSTLRNNPDRVSTNANRGPNADAGNQEGDPGELAGDEPGGDAQDEPGQTRRSGDRTGETGRNGDRDADGGRSEPDGGGGRGDADVPDAAPRGLTGENPGNFEIPADFDLGGGTPKQKIEANMAAIRLVKQLEAENRYPTRDEQAVLARYVGWGGLRKVVDPSSTGKSDIYGRTQAELKAITTPAEYSNIRQSTRNAHYTAAPVVNAMWRAMEHFGFRGGRALEPTVGSGNFLGLQPADMRADTEWHAAELDTLTGAIAKALYPDAKVAAGRGFETANYGEGVFDIAIGNPPFGAVTINDKDRPEISGSRIHNYIINKTGEHLRPGGVMAMVITHRFLDTQGEEGRGPLAKNFKMLGAIRLPNDAFQKNANTEVTTDIVFLQKLKEGERANSGAAWLDPNGQIEVDGKTMRVNRYFQENPQHILGRSALDGTMYAGRRGEEYTVHSDGRDLTAEIERIITEDFADMRGALGTRTEALESVADVDIKSNMAAGEMMIDGDGKIIRRTGSETEPFEVIDENTIWGDENEQFGKAQDALQRVLDATTDDDRDLAVQVFKAYAAVAYKADGSKSGAKDIPAHKQAVYDAADAIEAGQFGSPLRAAFDTLAASMASRRLGPTRYARLKGMLGLRRLTTRLLQAERTDAPNIEGLRDKLNRDYAAFRKANGFVNDPVNIGVLGSDVGLEVGLEVDYQPANKELKRKASAKPAAILSERVFHPHKEIVQADDPRSGLVISMTERGKVDLGYIARLTGIPVKDVIADLKAGENPAIFLNPETNEYEDAETYLSGNVKAKLDHAKEAGIAANIKALEAAMPAPLGQDRIVPSIRGQWIPTQVFEQFLRDMGVTEPKVFVDQNTGIVAVSSGGQRPTEFGSQFNDQAKDIDEIFTSAFRGKPLVVSYKDKDGNSGKDDEASRRVNALAKRMSEVFRDWAYQEPDRAKMIVDAYNEHMNTHVERAFDGVKYLRLVGASGKIDLRRSQKNAAWRMIQQRFTLLDHVVGAGKTFTVIAGVMERRRLGLSKKPLVAVPNHLVLQWAREWYQLYPGARLLAATPSDFEAKNRRKLLARIATGNYDAIIIGHSSLGFIENDAEFQSALMQEQIDELREALDAAKREGLSGRTLTQIEDRVDKYKAKISDLAERSQDRIGANFSEMGVDYLVVDEAHEFKNLEYATIGDRLVGMNDPKGSNRAFDLYVKVRSLRQNGGGVSFATGTPVSNSLVEIYSMMKYLAWDDMKARGQHSFDSWSSAYIEAETRFEYNAAQKLVERRVMSGLINLDGLSQLYRSFADVIDRPTMEAMYEADNGRKFPTPKVKGGARQLMTAKPTAKQVEFTDYLVARMEGIKANASDKDYPKIDNPLWVLSDARKASLDIRTIDPTLPRDENGKVMRAAREIKRIYDAWADDRGAQMVFSDLSTPSKTAQANARKILVQAFQLTMAERDAKARVKAALDGGKSYENTYAAAISAAFDLLESDNISDADRERLQEKMAALEEESPGATMLVADTGFSVYDDLRTVLVEMGIPENEIAFIHDYDTPERKAKLFTAMNNGDVRVLVGSTPKMGAGTNAQKRLVSLHHMDSPWRPSDVEQREGRIIRQGNSLYERDPEGFEVEILAYSTEGTSDVVLWQILERKARAIGRFRAGEIDTLDEGGNDADQYAEFMAQSTGNPVFRLQMEADRDKVETEALYSGLLLQRARAQNILRDYEADKRSTKAAADFFNGIDVGAIEYEGMTGTPEDLQEALDEVDRKFEETMARFLERSEAIRQERMKLHEDGVKDADLPKMPNTPSKPTALSKEVREKSAYAATAAKILEDAEGLSPGESIAFKVGTVPLLISYASTNDNGGQRYYTVELHSPREAGLWSREKVVADAHVRNVSQSRSIMSGLMPRVLDRKIKESRENYEWSIRGLEKRRADADEIMAKPLNTAAIDKARDRLAFFNLGVGFAEAQMRMDRAGRPNQFIASEGRRDMSAARDGGGHDTTGFIDLEFEGKPYRTTDGFVAPVPSKMLVPNVPHSEQRAVEVRDTKTGKAKYAIVRVEGAGKGQPPRVTMIDVIDPPDGYEITLTNQKPPAPTDKSPDEMRLDDEGNPNVRERRRPPRRIEDGQPEASVMRGLKASLEQELARLGIKGVSITAWRKIKSGPFALDGFYALGEGVIAIAADARDAAKSILHHELIHALRDPALWGGEAGIFTRDEWRTMVRAARENESLMSRIRRDYPDEPLLVQVEEAVAEMFRVWMETQDAGNPMARLFQRIRDVLGALGNALRGQGFTSAGMVFNRIANGEIGRRTQARDEQGRFTTDPDDDPGGPGGPGGGIRARRRPSDAPDPESITSFSVRAKNLRDGASQLASDTLTAAMNGSKGANLLALVPGRGLLSELGAKAMPALRDYLRTKEKMDTLRNKKHAELDEVAQKWRRLIGQNKTANQRMMDLMHESTIQGIDPTLPFVETATARDFETLRSGDPKSDAYKRADERISEDEARREKYDDLTASYALLPADFQRMFKTVRNEYVKMQREFEKAIEANAEKAMTIGLRRAERVHAAEMERIRDDGLTGQEKVDAIRAADEALTTARMKRGWSKNARLNQLRQRFESNKLAGPYFPLARFGDYFVTVRDPEQDGKIVSFSKFESVQDQRAHAQEMKAEGYEVEIGTMQEGSFRDMVDPNFVADVENLLEEIDADEGVMDTIWQRWLQTLPDFSIRKSKIHRKGTPGYTRDALRAFGHQMFHGAHQLARLTYALDLKEHLEIAEKEAREAPDPVRAGIVLKEVNRRHDYVMNPTGAWWSQALTSAAFVYYLAISPAAALVNLSQTSVMGTAILGAFHGKNGQARAGAELVKALKDFTRSRGNLNGSKHIAEDEARAMHEAYERGVIDKSEAYDLAGVGETGVEYSAVRTKVMSAISWFFHHAERTNREVTFLAAYRLAKDKGQDFNTAIATAGDLTWKTHFDYQNTSRPRLMQDNYMRVLLTFRNFQLNMLWRLFRDTHQAFNGADVETRAEARRQLVGITAQMFLHAGIKGVWGYSLLMWLAGMFFGGGDDDLAKQMEKALISTLGYNAAGMILNGVPGHLTGTDLTNRLGMPDLWFRSPDRTLEGEDEYNYWIKQFLGAVPGIAESVVRGAYQASEGNIYRGIETAAPRFFTDAMRTGRYMFEGAQTYNGDPIIEQFSPGELFGQAIGFTPARLAERYDANRRLKNEEKAILDRRSDIQKAAARSVMDGRGIPDDILNDIREFNADVPEYPITNDTLKRSIKSRAAASARNEFGIILNPRLNARLRDDAAPLIYDD